MRVEFASAAQPLFLLLFFFRILFLTALLPPCTMSMRDINDLKRICTFVVEKSFTLDRMGLTVCVWHVRDFLDPQRPSEVVC